MAADGGAGSDGEGGKAAVVPSAAAIAGYLGSRLVGATSPTSLTFAFAFAMLMRGARGSGRQCQRELTNHTLKRIRGSPVSTKHQATKREVIHVCAKTLTEVPPIGSGRLPPNEPKPGTCGRVPALAAQHRKAIEGPAGVSCNVRGELSRLVVTCRGPLSRHLRLCHVLQHTPQCTPQENAQRSQ